jgi:phosphatidylinositol 4-kinase
LTEIAEAWHWTVEKRVGLFSKTNRPPSPVSVYKVDFTTHIHRLDDPTPHRIWIDFLSERLTVIRNSHPQQLRILHKMMQQALFNPEGLR